MALASLARLDTPRLRLDRVQPDDRADLAAMHRDPAVMATLGGLRRPELEAAIFQGLLDDWSDRGIGWWVARERDSGRFVGRGGLRHVEADGHPEMEVGYGFVRSVWGRGYATELARAAVDAGFRQLGRADLVSFTLPDNRASRRVMEKCGFAFERDFVYKGHPQVLYRLGIEQWRASGRGRS